MNNTAKLQPLIWRPFCLLLMGCFLLGLFCSTLPVQSNFFKGLLKHDLCEVVDFAAEQDSSSSSSNNSKDSETIEDFHLGSLLVIKMLAHQAASLLHGKRDVSLPQIPHLSLNAPPPESHS
ncbi:MAG: hypothetical protein ACRCZY_00305 [Phocaeicola sp.]